MPSDEKPNDTLFCKLQQVTTMLHLFNLVGDYPFVLIYAKVVYDIILID